jgi:hypothetical protein
MRVNEIEANVKAYNWVATFAQALQTELKAIFTEYVGQQVIKVDGSLLANIQKKLSNLNNIPKVTIYQYRSRYTLVWNVKTSEPLANGSCIYREISVYVGDLTDGVLTRLYDNESIKTWTVEEVKGKLSARNEARRALDDANCALGPFND